MGFQTGDFTDNADRPIIAIDFDGTITKQNVFPEHGELRPYVREVIDLLRGIGVVVVIWTSRDDYHIEPLKQWLTEHEVGFDAINSVIEFAPFEYEARKIYAHMYVDDKAFGWYDRPYVMLDVLESFMINIMNIQYAVVKQVVSQLFIGRRVDIEQLKDYIHRRRMP